MKHSTRLAPRPVRLPIAWTLALGWAALTWVLLVTPPAPAGEPPGWLPSLADLAAIPGADKAGHAALFLVQALLLHRALLGRGALRPLSRLGWTLLATVLLGAATELRQRWVPGRDADALDLVADVGGALAYAALWALSRRLRPALPGRSGREPTPDPRRR